SLQEEYSIPRSGKAPYAQMVPKFEKAAKKVDLDPAEALETLEEILSDRRLKKRECRIRWEIQPGYWSEWKEFYPYQYRARASINLAQSAEGEKKRTFLEAAKKDLEESIRRGLPSSQKYLTEVGKALAALQVNVRPKDPEPEFRRKWQQLVSKDSFRNARAFVEKESSFLDEVRREKYLSDTDQACRDFLTLITNEFLGNLEQLTGFASLENMSRSFFLRQFALSDRGQLSVETPMFQWCLSVQDTLDDVRKEKKPLKPLLEHALAAVSLPEEGRLSAFLGIEKLAFDLLYNHLESRVEDSLEALSAQRATLRGEMDVLRKVWDDFLVQFQEISSGKEDFFMEVPERSFVELWSRLPVDSEELKTISSRLQTTLEAEDPQAAIDDLFRDLQKLRSKFSTLSIESRRSIVTLEIVTYSLGRFLAGDSISRVIKDSTSLGRDLQSLEGSFEVAEYGPKVQAVFRGLR
ncbi:MAG: hypothetical protein QF645_05715, partial [Planctomycetota bacterium]|nr:hypothetical protein [Planctomycetota bacterium]